MPTSTADRQTIRVLGPTQICRGSAELKECGTPIAQMTAQLPAHAAQLKQKPVASYTDTPAIASEIQSPSASITYAIEVLNRDGRGAGLSNRVRVPLIRTYLPPMDFRAQVTNQGIVLSWTNNLPATSPDQSVRYVYRVYRLQEGSKQAALVGELAAGSNPRLTLTDSGFEWEKTYEYHAETVTIVNEPNQPELQVDGDDTPEVRVFADDVFPPAVPSGLQAVFSGPGQQAFIDLVWAPVTDVDLGGYNIFRSEEGTSPIKLNPLPVKVPAYRDTSVVSGKRYVYSVSAVDIRGNESARSDEASESVP